MAGQGVAAAIGKQRRPQEEEAVRHGVETEAAPTRPPTAAGTGQRGGSYRRAVVGVGRRRGGGGCGVAASDGLASERGSGAHLWYYFFILCENVCRVQDLPMRLHSALGKRCLPIRDVSSPVCRVQTRLCRVPDSPLV